MTVDCQDTQLLGEAEMEFPLRAKRKALNCYYHYIVVILYCISIVFADHVPPLQEQRVTNRPVLILLILIMCLILLSVM